MPKDHTGKSAYLEKYQKLLNAPAVNNLTIIFDHIIVGSIAKFIMQDDTEIIYWLDRKFWGQAITTQALKIFLAIETGRPLFGRFAFDNFGLRKY